MKYLFLLALIAGGYYFYSNQSAEYSSISTYQELIRKAEVSAVTKEEVIAGSNMLAEFLCKDEHFQQSGGATVSACLANLDNSKRSCESSIFSSAPDTFESKELVVSYAKRYTACVGIK